MVTSCGDGMGLSLQGESAATIGKEPEDGQEVTNCLSC